jgi:hypothetical protein
MIPPEQLGKEMMKRVYNQVREQERAKWSEKREKILLGH